MINNYSILVNPIYSTLSLALYGMVFFNSPLHVKMAIEFVKLGGRINWWLIPLSIMAAIGPEKLETAVMNIYSGRFLIELKRLHILYFSINVFDSYIQFLLSIGLEFAINFDL